MKNLRRATILLTVVLMVSVVTPISGTTSQEFTPVTGWDMMEHLGIGINIGNTLDACPLMSGEELPANHMNIEVSWGETRIEQWHLDAIASKGFDHVRIPVTWENHILRNGNIRARWMDRVQEVVDMALDAGLYVVLNTHHERSRPDSLKVLIDQGDIPGAEAWIENIWGQISYRFRDYCERLIFEPMNEPFRAYRDGWIWCWDNYPHRPPVLDRELAERVNRMNRFALNVIRNSGGNNDRRVVVLGPMGADPEALRYYTHPNDRYTMLGIFFYPAHEEYLDDIVSAFDSGIPIYIKEIAPIVHLRTPEGQVGAVSGTDAAAWIREYFTIFADMGISTAYWNHEEHSWDTGWQIWSRSTGVWRAPLVRALFAAHDREIGPTVTPPRSTFPYVLHNPIHDNYGNFQFWTPGSVLNDADIMVIEHTGNFRYGYAFMRDGNGVPWTQFENGNSRITIEPGRIILDMTGLSGTRVGFAGWRETDIDLITRVYLDTR